MMIEKRLKHLNVVKILLGLILIVSMMLEICSINSYAMEVNKNGTVLSYNIIYNEIKPNNMSGKWYTLKTVGYSACYNLHVKNIDTVTTQTYSLVIDVYDSDGMKVYGWSQMNCSDLDNWMKLKENSAYFVCVSCQEGYQAKYNLKLSVDADAPDSISKAKSVKFGKVMTEYARVDEDNDFYKIKTSKGAAAYNLYVKNIDIYAYFTHSLVVAIYDKDKSEIYKTELAEGAELNTWFKFKPDKTYYIKFIGASGGLHDVRQTGKYKFKISCKNETGDTKKTAKTIKANKSYKKAIDAPNDIDWFQIKPNNTKKYNLKLKNVNDSSNIVVKIYKGKTLVNTISIPKGKTGSLKCKMTKNQKYYIYICSENNDSGNYCFSVK